MIRQYAFTLMLVLLLAVHFPAHAEPSADLNGDSQESMPAASSILEDTKTITGYWRTEDNNGVVEFYPCEKKICGRFHWLKKDSPENPSLDDKNPDPDKQSRPLCGMQFLGGFTPKGQGNFTGGWIYSPRHGSTFSASLTMKDQDTLDLHGYMFIPLFGESQIWRRTTADPKCMTAK